VNSLVQRTCQDVDLNEIKNRKKIARSRFQNFTSGAPNFVPIAHQTCLPVACLRASSGALVAKRGAPLIRLFIVVGCSLE
jgi:hypothetical protein